MNAVQVIDREQGIDVLNAPFNQLMPAELLAYFQTRQPVHYFAVADAAEVSAEKIADILVNRFSFNDEAYDLDELDWLNNPSSDIEWAIMLHKFYYAVGLGMAFQETADRSYAEKWQALTLSWITSVPLDFLPSDVMGRRVQNWVFAHYYFVNTSASDAITPGFYQQFLQSIHQQVSYLCEHLTPARNHRTLELYTIFLVAVVFPEFKDADDWLAFAIRNLSDNIQTDILADGVHCELSTDYHHIVLRNFLAVKRLAVLNKIALPPEIDDGIQKALLFSVYVHKPDGLIPSLSDGDTGSFLNLLTQGYEFYGCEAMRYVATQGKQGTVPAYRSKSFPASGYYILRSGWGEAASAYADERYLVFDCGDLGAGNHGHLDLLSFELAAYGQSLIVDPGRYTYDESGETNWRVKFRGTEYHNTVLVDGKNQTRYEAHSRKFKIKGSAPGYDLKAFVSHHTGFDYLHGVANSHEYPVVHERKILFVKGEYWIICDLLRAQTVHCYDLLFHLAATAQDKVSHQFNADSLIVDAPHLVMLQPLQPTVSLSLEPGYVSPTYGVKQNAPVLRYSQSGVDCCFYTLIYPYKTQRPVLSLSAIPVFNQHKDCTAVEACFLNIDLSLGEQVYRDSVFIANQPGNYQLGAQEFKEALLFQRNNAQGQLIEQFAYPATANHELR